MQERIALITPAHNEAQIIEQTIVSVCEQQRRPWLWLICDDASNDDTGQIVCRYQQTHPWIQYIRVNRGEIESYYGRRTKVFQYGYESIRSRSFQYIGALDADICLPAEYYERLVRAFGDDSRLGIASGVYRDMRGGAAHDVVRDPENKSTPGGIHMFRRECFDEIGGYKALPYGADDSLANIEAQMHGWRTAAITDCVATHLRPVGTRGGASVLRARFNQGLADYSIGTDLVFMLAKSARRTFVEFPIVVGALARLCGFVVHWVTRKPRCVSQDVVEFVKVRQRSRLRARIAMLRRRDRMPIDQIGGV